MTRSELIARLASRYPQFRTDDAEDVVQTIGNAMCQALQAGMRVEIRGFGVFERNFRKARRGRNPRTGEVVDTPPKFVPHFRPGKDLRHGINPNIEFTSRR